MRLLALAALVLAFSQPASGDEGCVIPPGPPCLPFSDPRWEDPTCKASIGACWYLLTGTVSGPPVTEATVTIVPVCGNPGSHTALREAAFAVLSELNAEEIEVTVITKPCSDGGYADVKIG